MKDFKAAKVAAQAEVKGASLLDRQEKKRNAKEVDGADPLPAAKLIKGGA